MPNGKSHDWSLDYDPDANAGNGRMTVGFDGRKVYLDLERGIATRRRSLIDSGSSLHGSTEIYSTYTSMI